MYQGLKVYFERLETGEIQELPEDLRITDEEPGHGRKNGKYGRQQISGTRRGKGIGRTAHDNPISEFPYDTGKPRKLAVIT
jgi:hypothetical protein